MAGEEPRDGPPAVVLRGRGMLIEEIGGETAEELRAGLQRAYRADLREVAPPPLARRRLR